MTSFVTKAMPIHYIDSRCHIKFGVAAFVYLVNQYTFISYDYIVFNSLEGRETYMRAHTCTHAHTHTHT